MRVLTFEGTPTAIGEAFGETCKREIHELYRLRIANAVEQAQSYGHRAVDEGMLLSIARRCLPQVEHYHPPGHLELAGVARGAGLRLEQVWAMNALTDLRDVAAFGEPALMQGDAEGCSSFVVQDNLTGGGVLCGQTWDLATDNMPFVVAVERKPVDQPKTVCMTLVGCLSLIGMNEHGVAVGNTNLRTVDSKIGVGYLDIIHCALASRDLETAAEAVRRAPRAGAHYYYLVDQEGGAMTLECTATLLAESRIETGHFVHCNHLLHGAHQKLEAPTPASSSHHRQERLSELLETSPRPLDVAAMQRHFADHAGAPLALCRHDVDGISSNGAIIMAPKERRIWVVHGPPCRGDWVELSL